MVRESLGQIQFERVHLDDDTYSGKIAEISDVYEATTPTGKRVEKVRIDIKTEGGDLIPQFLTATVSDAGEHNKKYSNSKLYDLLKKADALDAYEKVREEVFKEGLDPEIQNARFVGFLRQELVDRDVKVTTKTVTPESGEQYSVAEIMRFLDQTVVEETVVA